MWLQIERAGADGSREEMLPGLERLAQFLDEMQARFRPVGVSGVSGAVQRARQLRAVLDGVRAEDLAGARADLARLIAWWDEAARQLATLRRLQGLVG